MVTDRFPPAPAVALIPAPIPTVVTAPGVPIGTGASPAIPFCCRVFDLATKTPRIGPPPFTPVQPPESPLGFCLRLDVYPLPQVLQTYRRICHSPAAFLLSELLTTAGPLRSTEITPLQRYYRPIRHPLACSRFPGVAGYTAALLHAFPRGTRRASPVALSTLVAVLSLHTPPDHCKLSVSYLATCCLRP